MKRLLIFGTGSQARYVIENLRYARDVIIEGLIDLESPENVGKQVNGVPILAVLHNFSQREFPPKQYYVIVAYGNNRKKKDIVSRLEDQGYRFLSAISPAAYIAYGVTIGVGCIVNPHVAILPNATIGDHVIIHSGAVIEHDCVVRPYANIAPGVSFGGRVYVGEGAYVYTGSVVIPDVRIGEWAIVGAGTVVLKNVPDNTTVVGVPARIVGHKGNKK